MYMRSEGEICHYFILPTNRNIVNCLAETGKVLIQVSECADPPHEVFISCLVVSIVFAAVVASPGHIDQTTWSY